MFLVHRPSQLPVPAEIDLITPEELKQVRAGFVFDWLDLKEMEIYALWVVGEKKIAGLLALKDVSEELRIEIALLECSKENVGKSKSYEQIAGCLIAFACRLAFLRGYFGFVSLIPKTRLIEHYKSVYGFEQYGRHLALDLERSQHLIEKYLNDER